MWMESRPSSENLLNDAADMPWQVTPSLALISHPWNGDAPSANTSPGLTEMAQNASTKCFVVVVDVVVDKWIFFSLPRWPDSESLTHDFHGVFTTGDSQTLGQLGVRWIKSCRAGPEGQSNLWVNWWPPSSRLLPGPQLHWQLSKPHN